MSEGNLRLTEEEIRYRAVEFVAQELYELRYEAYDLGRLSDEDIWKVVSEMDKVADWHKEELKDELKKQADD